MIEEPDRDDDTEEEQFRNKLMLDAEKEKLSNAIQNSLSLSEQVAFYGSIRIIEKANKETLMYLLTKAYFDIIIKDKQMKSIAEFFGVTNL